MTRVEWEVMEAYGGFILFPASVGDYRCINSKAEFPSTGDGTGLIDEDHPQTYFYSNT